MSDGVVTHIEQWLAERGNLNSAEQVSKTLKTGGGDGTSGGMEGRIAKLEAHSEALRADMAVVKNDVGSLKVSLATLTERTSHLPGKGFVVLSTTTSLALLTGMIIFADRLRLLLLG